MNKAILVLATLLLITLPAAAQSGCMSAQQIIDLVWATLPNAYLMPKPSAVVYNRLVYDNLPGELPIGSAVVFNATAQMGIGQTGVTYGVVTGYNLEIQSMVCPANMTGPVQREQWGALRYIIRFIRAPGSTSYGDQLMLSRDQFQTV